MATFHTSMNQAVFKHDDYMTPHSAWDDIKKYIPTDKVIWEPFFGDGSSGEWFLSNGFECIHKPIDFFDHNLGDIIISNPPFSKKREIFKRLKELGKPFIMIAPASTICYQYLYKDFHDEKLQLIVPAGRINFIKKVNGVIPEGFKSRANFDCLYFCWKMNLPDDLIFLRREKLVVSSKELVD